jgi:hypothetical protein
MPHGSVLSAVDFQLPGMLAPCGLFALGAVAVAVLGIAGVKAQAKRREALLDLAARLGLRFSPGDDPFHDEQYAHFELFRRGHSRSAYNTLQGTLTLAGLACPIKAGDFTYKVTSGSGKDRKTTTYRFSYLIAHLPFARVPDILIRPEGVLDRMADFFGRGDIDFESAEFSRRFFVRCADRRFAYDLIHQRMQEFLLAERPPAIDLELGRLCLTDGSRLWQPADFEHAVAFLDRFLALWPDYVVKDLTTTVPTNDPPNTAPSGPTRPFGGGG